MSGSPSTTDPEAHRTTDPSLDPDADQDPADAAQTRGQATLTFHGAAGTVTGSRFLVRTAQAQILVDCGLFQGERSWREHNWDAPFVDPATLDAVVLTHAHLDHSGSLPVLARDGFRGPIWCTAGTAQLAAIVLTDAA